MRGAYGWGWMNTLTRRGLPEVAAGEVTPSECQQWRQNMLLAGRESPTRNGGQRSNCFFLA